MLELRGVGKSYDERATWVVRNFDLKVESGELVALLGESGCGKTTTLKMINRLIEPSEGTIEIDGDDARARDPVTLRRGIGYVFQGVGLFPHISIAENVGIVPKLLGWPQDKIDARVDELLDAVALEPSSFRGRMPSELSGGQRQRVGFARALAGRPSILLMDEPFGALDPLTRDALQREVRRIHDTLQLTTVLVTHDMAEALLLADRIAVMSAGKIVQLGTPRQLMQSPANDYVDELVRTPREHARRLDELARDTAEDR